MSPAAVEETTCSASSLAAGEPLAGSATVATRWLLVEVPGRWGRDVDDTELPSGPDGLEEVVRGFDGRVQLIRRPDRRRGEPALFVGESSQAARALHRARISGGALDLSDEPAQPIVLVCCHGRRDACCARLGTPVFDALVPHLDRHALWQTSHLGGHRFAANVLVLPAGVLLGRVAPDDAPRLVAAVLAGRVPLEHYRGRTSDPAEAQAADAAVRTEYGLAGLDDVRVLGVTDDRVRLETAAGEIEARVDVEGGPPVADSCGKEAAPSRRYRVRW